MNYFEQLTGVFLNKFFLCMCVVVGYISSKNECF